MDKGSGSTTEAGNSESTQGTAATNNDVEAEHDNIQRIQAECSNMMALLKNLQSEERDLNCQLEILAREALLCGFQPELIEPPIPKRRKTVVNNNKKKDKTP